MAILSATQEPQHQPSPRSAVRIPHILRLLADRPAGATLADLSAWSGTPKSSLLALLRALTAGGYLGHRGGRYAIGPEALKLASSIVAQRKFPDIAVGIVDALANATGESALLAELATDAPAAVYIYKAESRNALRFIAALGAREPLYSSAVGRVLLAFQPRDWQEEYLGTTKLAPLTPKTIKSKRELKRILERVRRERRATSLEETIDGVVGIAAPVFDRTGALLAGLVIGMPVARALARLPALEVLVSESAAEISRLMGFADGHRHGSGGGAEER